VASPPSQEHPSGPEPEFPSTGPPAPDVAADAAGHRVWRPGAWPVVAPHLHTVPAWARPSEVEQRTAAAAAVVVAIGLQLVTPSALVFGPRWLVPAVEVALLVVLGVSSRQFGEGRVGIGRLIAVMLSAVLAAANLTSTALLVHALVSGGGSITAGRLLGSGVCVWVTNVIAFALLYWELDRGGPLARAAATHPFPDFLFPQMAQPGLAAPDWEPYFADYLYVSFTNATAFSPTDTMPLSRWSKGLMLVQSGVALVTVGLVFARAVNVL